MPQSSGVFTGLPLRRLAEALHCCFASIVLWTGCCQYTSAGLCVCVVLVVCIAGSVIAGAVTRSCQEWQFHCVWRYLHRLTRLVPVLQCTTSDSCLQYHKADGSLPRTLPLALCVGLRICRLAAANRGRLLATGSLLEDEASRLLLAAVLCLSSLRTCCNKHVLRKQSVVP